MTRVSRIFFFAKKQIETVDPSEYHLRIHFDFEAAAEAYAWINHIIAVGTGRRTAAGIAYSVYQIL